MEKRFYKLLYSLILKFTFSINQQVSVEIPSPKMVK